LAFGVWRGRGWGKREWANGRYGEWAKRRYGEVVPTAFEDEDDDEYEDDGIARRVGVV
jgi:hypothetical protein